MCYRVFIEDRDYLCRILGIGCGNKNLVLGPGNKKDDESKYGDGKNGKSDDDAFLSRSEFVPPRFDLFNCLLDSLGHCKPPER